MPTLMVDTCKLSPLIGEKTPINAESHTYIRHRCGHNKFRARENVAIIILHNIYGYQNFIKNNINNKNKTTGNINSQNALQFDAMKSTRLFLSLGSC